MSRLTMLIWMVIVVVASFSLYAVKYQVQSVRQQVADTSRELEKEREALRVAAAEWAYLNRPERLRQLAGKYLTTADVTVSQLAEVQAIPFPSQTVAALDDSGDVKPAAVMMRKAR